MGTSKPPDRAFRGDGAELDPNTLKPLPAAPTQEEELSNWLDYAVFDDDDPKVRYIKAKEALASYLTHQQTALLERLLENTGRTWIDTNSIEIIPVSAIKEELARLQHTNKEKS